MSKAEEKPGSFVNGSSEITSCQVIYYLYPRKIKFVWDDKSPYIILYDGQNGYATFIDSPKKFDMLWNFIEKLSEVKPDE